MWFLTPIIFLIAFGLRVDVHPPGYFALLHQWIAIAGRSEYALRYLSVIFSMLTLALLMRFGRALVGRYVGGRGVRIASRRGASAQYGALLTTGALAALSPLYVAYAQEVRMYASVTFFALASVYFQWRVLGDWRAGGSKSSEAVGTDRRASEGYSPVWPLAGYSLATAASLYTHYFTVFLLLFQNLAWMLWALMPDRPERTKRGRILIWAGSQFGILLLFLPQLPLALQQTVAYSNPNLNPPAVTEFISRSWLAYTIGTAVDKAVGGWLVSALAAILGLTVLIQIVDVQRGTHSSQRAAMAFLMGWFLIPLIAYYLVLQRRPSFEPRYMMLVTPALMLLLAWGLTGVMFSPRVIPWRVDGAALRGRLWRWPGLVVALAIFGAGTWFYFMNVEAHKDDSAGVAAWLAAETSRRDVVYTDVPHPFHYYADRIPAQMRYLFVDIHTVADVLNAEAVGRDRLFWVTWWGSDTDPRGVIPFLLDKAGRARGELDFRGYHITWWDLTNDTRFSLPNDLWPRRIIFGDVVQLDGLAFSSEAQIGQAAWATMHLTLIRDTNVDYRVSLRLRSLEGDMHPPIDKDLLNDRHFRTSAWPLDDPRLNQAINVYTLPIPSETPAGDYCLEAVVYAATTTEALPLTGFSGSGCAFPARDSVSAQLGRVVVSLPME